MTLKITYFDSELSREALEFVKEKNAGRRSGTYAERNARRITQGKPPYIPVPGIRREPNGSLADGYYMVPQDTAEDIAKRRSAVKGDREKMEKERKRYEEAQKKQHKT